MKSLSDLTEAERVVFDGPLPALALVPLMTDAELRAYCRELFGYDPATFNPHLSSIPDDDYSVAFKAQSKDKGNFWFHFKPHKRVKTKRWKNVPAWWDSCD